MYNFLVILILIVSILLAVVVLVQNSKGGGLAANFSAPNQIMGVRKTTDFLEKATWVLAAALMVLSLIATVTIHNGRSSQRQQSELTTEAAAPAPTAAEAMNANATAAMPAATDEAGNE